jgi:hypothetical protein
MFAARYTTYTILPQEHTRGSAPPGYYLELTLALAHERDESGVAGPAVLGPRISTALNQGAGGRRQFGATPVFIDWRVNWSPLRVLSGRVLGVAVLNDDLFDALDRPGHPSAAQTLLVLGGDREYGRMIFRSSSFVAARTHGRRVSGGERIRSTFTHEVGHALGLDDQRTDPSSTMYYQQLTNRQYRRLDQRWSDGELRLALQNIFTGPGRTRPAWLV